MVFYVLIVLEIPKSYIDSESNCVHGLFQERIEEPGFAVTF
jgi:hypothetical protein